MIALDLNPDEDKITDTEKRGGSRVIDAAVMGFLTIRNNAFEDALRFVGGGVSELQVVHGVGTDIGTQMLS